MKSVLHEAKQNQAQNCIDYVFKYSQHILRHPNAMHNGPFPFSVISLVPTQNNLA